MNYFFVYIRQTEIDMDYGEEEGAPMTTVNVRTVKSVNWERPLATDYIPIRALKSIKNTLFHIFHTLFKALVGHARDTSGLWP